MHYLLDIIQPYLPIESAHQYITASPRYEDTIYCSVQASVEYFQKSISSRVFLVEYFQ